MNTTPMTPANLRPGYKLSGKVIASVERDINNLRNYLIMFKDGSHRHAYEFEVIAVSA